MHWILEKEKCSPTIVSIELPLVLAIVGSTENSRDSSSYAKVILCSRPVPTRPLPLQKLILTEPASASGVEHKPAVVFSHVKRDPIVAPNMHRKFTIPLGSKFEP
jgi:hypothetical protein